MSNQLPSGLSRRDVLKASGTIAAASALAGVAVPKVHAAENNTIQLALVGCGGRGTGAAVRTPCRRKNGPTKLVAMADVFPTGSATATTRSAREFDEAGRRARRPQVHRLRRLQARRWTACKPGDVVILTTPPAFRWVHFTYAIEKGLNVFMEKPVTVDGPSTPQDARRWPRRRSKKNLKVGVGLMCRHCAARGELFERIKDGRDRRHRPAAGLPHAPARPARFDADPSPTASASCSTRSSASTRFLWASGGAFSDFLIHNIDECCWMKDAWPVEAKGSGGRHYRGDYVDQNFDTYSVEYTFADGTKLFLEGRNMPGCHQEFASYAHGTQGLGGHLDLGPHAGPVPHLQGPEHRPSDDLSWALSRSRSRIPTSSNGTT